MKFFTVIFFVIAVTCMAKADDDSHSSHCSGLAYLLGPILKLLQPLLSGVNCGLQSGAVQVAKGVGQVGDTLESTVDGVGTIVGNTVVGAGGTVKDLPAGLYKTTKNLQTHCGTVSTIINTLTGAPSTSHHHEPSHHSTSSM